MMSAGVSLNNDKFTLGLTGGIGSGKSVASDFFAQHGICIADADVAARTVVMPGTVGLQRIVERFGDTILLNGELNRRQLRNIIFESAAEKTWLEQLLHPLIREQLINELNFAESPYRILASPLLLESNQWQLVNSVMVIDVPEAVQIERATARDQMTVKQVRAIICSQMRRNERLIRADIVVDNSRDLTQLFDQLEILHQRFLLESL